MCAKLDSCKAYTKLVTIREAKHMAFCAAHLVAMSNNRWTYPKEHRTLLPFLKWINGHI